MIIKEPKARLATEAGQTDDIRLNYCDYQGSEKAQPLWSSPSQVQEIIPQQHLHNNSSRIQDHEGV